MDTTTTLSTLPISTPTSASTSPPANVVAAQTVTPTMLRNAATQFGTPTFVFSNGSGFDFGRFAMAQQTGLYASNLPPIAPALYNQMKPNLGYAFSRTPGVPMLVNKKLSNAAEKRANHNAIERARRDSLNNRFQEIADCIPSLREVKKPSKSTIMQKTLEYIKTSQRKMDVQAREIATLKKENEKLRKEAKGLKQMMVSAQEKHGDLGFTGIELDGVTPHPSTPPEESPEVKKEILNLQYNKQKNNQLLQIFLQQNPDFREGSYESDSMTNNHGAEGTEIDGEEEEVDDYEELDLNDQFLPEVSIGELKSSPTALCNPEGFPDQYHHHLHDQHLQHHLHQHHLHHHHMQLNQNHEEESVETDEMDFAMNEDHHDHQEINHHSNHHQLNHPQNHLTHHYRIREGKTNGINAEEFLTEESNHFEEGVERNSHFPKHRESFNSNGVSSSLPSSLPSPTSSFTEGDYLSDFDNYSEPDSFNFDTMREKVQVGLNSRHDKHWLMDQNILKTGLPNLQAQQKLMEFQIKKQNLNMKLSSRPSVDDLIGMNIIQHDDD